MSSSSSKETTYKQVNMCLHTCTYTITHNDSAVHAVPKLFAKYGSNYRTNSGSQSASVKEVWLRGALELFTAGANRTA